MTTWDERMTRAPSPEPLLELVETCWRMQSRQSSQRIVACGIYRVAFGLEIRGYYEPDDLLHSQRVPDLEQGRQLASMMKQRILNQGGFDELPPSVQ